MQRFSLIALCLSALVDLCGQSEMMPFSNREGFSKRARVEKVFLDTDRSYFMAGETLYFKAYLTDQSLQQGRAESTVLYVDLIDGGGKVIDSRTVDLAAGSGRGQIELNPRLSSGFYALRAHTAFMRNHGPAFFFRKQILVKAPGQAIPAPTKGKAVPGQVRCFPEGGELVVGLESKIAIKVANNEGATLALTGQLLTLAGEELATFSTNDSGLGQIRLRPEPGAQYKVAVDFAGTIVEQELPRALAEGVVLAATSNQDALGITLEATAGYEAMEGGWLFGHLRGNVILEKKLKAGKEQLFQLPKEKLPTGIIHFTVFDKAGHPLAERLVFNNHGLDAFNVDAFPDREVYGKRERVELSLDVYDDEGEALPADLSVTVIRKFLETPEEAAHDIRSYLLLGSDLRGAIVNPQAYFEDSEEAILSLDLLMLTHGWRRFRWEKWSGQDPGILPEKGLTLTGTITEKGKPDHPVEAYGYLSELSAAMSMNEFETGLDGRFRIGGLQVRDSVDLILQAATLTKRKREKMKGKDMLTLKGNRNVDIVVDSREPYPAGAADNGLTQGRAVRPDYMELLQNRTIYDRNSDDWDGLLSVDMDEVTISEKRINPIVDYYEESMLYRRPDTRIMTESISSLSQYRNVYDILRGRVAGLRLDAPEEPGTQHSIILRGYKTGLSKSVKMSNAAQFAVNGAWVSATFAESINPNDIAFIDVLSTLEKLTRFGELGNNGMVMIYLKPPGERQGAKQKTYNGILNFLFKGYDSAREFYAPEYASANEPNERVDDRITLHWEPDVRIGDSGEAVIDFFTGDRSGQYTVIIEGISQSGIPIVARSKIEVQ